MGTNPQAPHSPKEKVIVMIKCRKGDHVSWNSEAEQVSGKIIKIHCGF
jgi:hypothetical protein